MKTLADLVSGTRTLLLDFDGPICAVFAGYPADTIAGELHTILRQHLGDAIPPAIAANVSDPLQVLLDVAPLGDKALTEHVADACRDAEVVAVATATPTDGAEELLLAAQDSGRRVVIVSNNATEAVAAYLHAYNLGGFVSGIAARSDGMDPRQLKPDPFLLHRGLAAAHAQAGDAIFVGDSVSDIEAGRAASVPTIGYANKPGKDHRLTAAGADIVIGSMLLLADAVQSTPAMRPM